MNPITVSSNRRFLQDNMGQPFFWLADTAWELFHRTTEEEAAYYLNNRARQGYTVIQAVILAECDGLRTPNSNGHIPLLGDDPARPNEYYFRYVDKVLEMARERGLYVGLLPTWGDKVHSGLWGEGPAVFTEGNARVFGRFLGERYREQENILWVIGGDRPADSYGPVWSAMAGGVEEGLGRRPLRTFHPPGGSSSSQWVHDESWLDMNMLQSGHMHRDHPNWEMIEADYNRQPTKPVLDGEPCYEGHPINIFTRKWKPAYGRFTPYDVRKAAYRSVFYGACGYTYGHHGIWQFWNNSRKPVNNPMIPWEEAILCPGAEQMVHLKNLMLSRSYFDRVPDQDILRNLTAYGQPKEDIPSDPVREAHPAATRAADGSWIMIYYPLSNQELELELPAGHYTARWYDPRTGESHDTDLALKGNCRVSSPLGGPDWVLILERNMPDSQ